MTINKCRVCNHKFFEEPLKDIIKRGLKIKYFGKYVDTCLIAEDRKFINDYVVKKI